MVDVRHGIAAELITPVVHEFVDGGPVVLGVAAALLGEDDGDSEVTLLLVSPLLVFSRHGWQRLVGAIMLLADGR